MRNCTLDRVWSSLAAAYDGNIDKLLLWLI